MGKCIHTPTGKSPQSEILHSHAPYGTAPETHTGIFPVAMLCIGIDIFICQVDAACEPGLAVDDADLTVIPIIEPRGENGVEGIENADLQSLFPQLAVVVAGQSEQAAQVVIHQPDFHALLDLPLQNLEDGVPHGAFLNDKILQKDKGLRFFQLPQECSKECLTNRKIFCLGMAAGRRSGGTQKITDLDGRIWHLQSQTFHSGVFRFHDRGDLFAYCPAGGALFPGHPVFSKQQIQQSAEDGEEENGNQPGNFVGRVAGGVVQNVNRGSQGKKHADNIEIGELIPEEEKHNDQCRYLDRDKQCHVQELSQNPIQTLAHDELLLVEIK